MNLSEQLSQSIQEAFAKVGIAGEPIILKASSNPNFGDYQINGVMGAAKLLEKNPRD